ncbi:ArsR/SmtB family transcription factor [Paeniglutamicibacter cryotolerans]|uniref:ArsR family transcriptional regulator n=1 Tax=Paeniglutamicibacter cryotolerans TaxID=670079 RepID=A0A839QZ16_9MICC|nr:metalloregulator ArsR/SmtB family transcription factor [Paeniglutamicibacter cryotolerans]MBB2997211.1 ArsR family transcriptional regulator [Paeniglutamicibacter cryotolerans]
MPIPVATETNEKNLAVSARYTNTPCCIPFQGQVPLLAGEAEALAARFKALADPNRLRILSIVSSSPTAETCVCDLSEPLSLGQPTVSHHLKILVEAGLLNREKRGVWAYYSLVPGALDSLAATLVTK